MMPAPERDEVHPRHHRILRALDYPYAAPVGSWRLGRSGRLHHLRGDGLVRALREMNAARTPVVAFGSNGSPAQIRRKFGLRPKQPILSLSGRLSGFDVVYAARLSGYGAVPATLAPCAGVTLPVSIQWLTDEQLEIMHVSEGVGRGGYRFVALPPGAVRLTAGGRVVGACTYLAEAGPLLVSGEPVAIATRIAAGRRWRSCGQTAMQERVRRELAPETELHGFILANARDARMRAAWNRRLARMAG